MFRKINKEYPLRIQEAKAQGWVEITQSKAFVILKKQTANRVYNTKIRITYA